MTATAPAAPPAALPRLDRCLLMMVLACLAGMVFLAWGDLPPFAVNIGGMTFRAMQVFQGLFLLLGLAVIMTRRAVVPVPGAVPLIGFLVLNLMLAVVAPGMVRSVGYGIWLIFNALLVLALPQILAGLQALTMRRVMQLYLLGFVLAASLGVFQFVTVMAGLDLFPSRVKSLAGLPRVHIFMYEPSFYGTYLAAGFVTLLVLCDRACWLFPRFVQIAALGVVILAMVLSVSRMAMALLLAAAAWFVVWSLVRLVLMGRTSIVRLLVITALVSAGATAAYVLYELLGYQFFRSLMQGVGGLFAAEDISSHSIDDRTTGMRDTFLVWLENPLLGVSLGGVAEAIAAMRGVPRVSADGKEIEGLNVFAEILAGTGIVGFALFMWFLSAVIGGALWKRAQLIEPYASWLQALAIASFVQLLMLFWNQNILRPYVWMHLAMLAGVSVWVRGQRQILKR